MEQDELDMFKICTYCKLEKDISNFSVKNRKTRKNQYKQYFSIYCKKCECIKSNIWRKSNPDKVKQQNCSVNAKISKENWLKNNKDKRKEYERKYYLNNIEKFKANSKTDNFKNNKRLYKRNKRNNDALFRVRDNISNRINKALRNGKSNKAGQSILKYLGYTISDLKNHLENQFDDKMSWNNYGIYWHIDHIIPHSNFKYTSMEDNDFKICWALNNLRPLEAHKNMSDGARK